MKKRKKERKSKREKEREKEKEEKARKEIGKVPRWWKRFVDNVFEVWRGTKEELVRFVGI